MHTIYWSGHITDMRLRLDTINDPIECASFQCYSVLAPNKQWDRLFCCCNADNFIVSEFEYREIDENHGAWNFVQTLDRYAGDDKEMLLQLKLDPNDLMLLGTTGRGFVIWNFDAENSIGFNSIYLSLPHGVRNITTKMMTSNSIMVSSKMDYAVAGVRYVYFGFRMLRSVSQPFSISTGKVCMFGV